MATPQPRLDGRLARGIRARAAIVDSMLSLFEEGDIRPSAARIAQRAGVSLRTVFQHFRDMETLLAAGADRQRERLVGLIRPLPATGPLATRVQAFVRQRSTLLEHVTPVRRAALLHAPFSNVLAKRLAEFRGIKAAQVRRVFARELAGVPAASRRNVAAALIAVSSWSFWEELRTYQGLSLPHARRAMQTALCAIASQGDVA